MPPKNKKLALNSGIQTNQILTNDDEVCIPSWWCAGKKPDGLDLAFNEYYIIKEYEVNFKI